MAHKDHMEDVKRSILGMSEFMQVCVVGGSRQQGVGGEGRRKARGQ